VNPFVDECRSEWRRLGVPDPVANEMAADLAADLSEAEADGASPEDVLGSGAFDPRAFATAWAAERGLIRRPPRKQGALRSAVLAAAIVCLTLVAIVGAAVLVVDSRSASARTTLPYVPLSPESGAMWVHVDSASDPLRLPITITPGPPGSDARIVTAPLELPGLDEPGVDKDTLGAILVLVGLAGLLPLTVWQWVDARRLRRLERA
jgi:hypothetical protein